MNLPMESKTFRIITSIAMVFTLMATLPGIAGLIITGLYPGFFVLLLLTLIPLASRFYAKKMDQKPDDVQNKYTTPLIVINLLVIFVALWMTFVIVHDRVLQDCC